MLSSALRPPPPLKGQGPGTQSVETPVLFARVRGFPPSLQIQSRPFKNINGSLKPQLPNRASSPQTTRQLRSASCVRSKTRQEGTWKHARAPYGRGSVFSQRNSQAAGWRRAFPPWSSDLGCPAPRQAFPRTPRAAGTLPRVLEPTRLSCPLCPELCQDRGGPGRCHTESRALKNPSPVHWKQGSRSHSEESSLRVGT